MVRSQPLFFINDFRILDRGLGARWGIWSRRHAPNIDQPILLVSASSAIRPKWEFPETSRPGDQTAIEALPGAIANIPPPTPLLPGRPTR